MESEQVIKKFADELVMDLGAIDDWSPEQTYHAAKLIKKNKEIAGRIASGNLNFLEQAVDFYDENYLEIVSGKKSFVKYANGIKKHIRKALPHQWGHIAATENSPVAPGIRGYGQISREIKNIEDLSINGVIQLTREVTTDPELKSVRGQSANIKTLARILGTYDRKVADKGVEVAQKYIHSASSSGKIRIQSVKNILKKSYLPNLEGHLARK